MEDKNQPPHLNIELTEEMAEGIYSNLAIITHSNSEFVIDFIRLMPGVPKAKVKSRIVITPEHAKRLLAALKDNIEKYEASFGAIKQTPDGPKFPMNFGGAVGEDKAAAHTDAMAEAPRKRNRDDRPPFYRTHDAP